MTTDQKITDSHGDILSAMLLDWVGQAPVTIHRAFIDLTGNVLCALWLTYALDKGRAWERSVGQEGTVKIEMTSGECERDTGITRAQQQTCRRLLLDLGILTEAGGLGRAIEYTLDTRHLLDLLMRQAQPLADALRASRGLGESERAEAPGRATASRLAR